MLGLLGEAAARFGFHLHPTGDRADIPENWLSGDDHIVTTAAALRTKVPEKTHAAPEIFVQLHADKDDRYQAGFYRCRDGGLEPHGNAMVRRKDVIAINQAIYNRASFGVALMARRSEWYAAFVDLGRLLHRLQTSHPALGFMSSDYSFLSGHEMKAAARLSALVGTETFGGQAPMSYFAIGGGISAEQRASRGMEEDVVHMRGPAEIFKDDLRELVPEYMVPSTVRIASDIPLTPNRKIDLGSLRAVLDQEEQAKRIIPPRTSTEVEIASI